MYPRPGFKPGPLNLESSVLSMRPLHLHYQHMVGLTVRVHSGPGKPGKFWSLFWHFPRLDSPGKRPLVLESSGNLLNTTTCEKYKVGGSQ